MLLCLQNRTYYISKITYVRIYSEYDDYLSQIVWLPLTITDDGTHYKTSNPIIYSKAKSTNQQWLVKLKITPFPISRLV